MILDSKNGRWWLEQWGMWSRTGNRAAYTSPAFALYRANVQTPDNRERHVITDDEAMMVDKLVAALGSKNTRHWQAVVLWHMHRLTLTQLAEAMNCSRKTAEVELKSGEGWIDGAMSARAA